MKVATPLVPIYSRSVTFPKTDGRDWEDAVALSHRSMRYAVADGVSVDSFASRDWAQSLVQAYVKAPAGASERETFERLQQDWAARRPTTDVRRAIFDAGSFATFLGISFQIDRDRTLWTASAVGDSCLFHVRKGVLVKSFPLTDSGQFNNTPPLVASHSAADDIERLGKRAAGELRKGDVILLATDELSQWALCQGQTSKLVWSLLCCLDQRSLNRLVLEERATGRMKADDISLVQISMNGR